MTTEHAQPLFEALGITDTGGIVCAVGAGGKKSLLYALAREATGRTGLTTTVMTLRFPNRWRKNAIVDDDATLLRTLAIRGDTGIHAYACPSDKPGRWAGVASATIVAIHGNGGFDLTLIKADGARMRGIKAPKPGEPVLPAETALVCPVVSAGVLGQPLNAETAHRPELLAGIVGAKPDTPLAPEHLVRLLISEQGALQGAAGRRVVPVINQVDSDALRSHARAVAQAALDATDRFDRVVLACLRDERPVVETVFRQ